MTGGVWHDPLGGPEEFVAIMRRDAELESAEDRYIEPKRREMDLKTNLPLDDHAQTEDDVQVDPASGVEEEARAEDNVKIEVFDPDGKKVGERHLHNLVVTIGKNGIADQLLASPTINKPSHMAIGTGGGGPAAGDTALTTELDRNALTSKTRSTNTVTMVGDWAAGDGTGTITEAGIFDASSSGNLFVRAVFGAVTKNSADSLRITWQLSVA